MGPNRRARLSCLSFWLYRLPISLRQLLFLFNFYSRPFFYFPPPPPLFTYTVNFANNCWVRLSFHSIFFFTHHMKKKKHWNDQRCIVGKSYWYQNMIYSESYREWFKTLTLLLIVLLSIFIYTLGVMFFIHMKIMTFIISH